MRSIIIPASKSLSISSKNPDGNISNGNIMIGNDGYNDYVGYLYFDISDIPDNISNLKAELVLFKTDVFYQDNKSFILYPTIEYFSSATTFRNFARFSDSYEKIFNPFTTRAAVEIDVTDIVDSWLKGTIINRGLVILGGMPNARASFGAAVSSDYSLVPFLRVGFHEVRNEGRVNLVSGFGGSEDSQIIRVNPNMIKASIVTSASQNNK